VTYVNYFTRSGCLKKIQIILFLSFKKHQILFRILPYNLVVKCATEAFMLLNSDHPYFKHL
jgi:hypothetical protein